MFSYWFATPVKWYTKISLSLSLSRERERERERDRQRERKHWRDYMYRDQGKIRPVIYVQIFCKNKAPIFKYLNMIVRIYLLQY